MNVENYREIIFQTDKLKPLNLPIQFYYLHFLKQMGSLLKSIQGEEFQMVRNSKKLKFFQNLTNFTLRMNDTPYILSL